MDPDWNSVYSTRDPMEAEQVKALLRRHGIEAVQLDRVDHCHGKSGNIEVYCHPAQAEAALQLIKKRADE